MALANFCETRLESNNIPIDAESQAIKYLLESRAWCHSLEDTCLKVDESVWAETTGVTSHLASDIVVFYGGAQIL